MSGPRDPSVVITPDAVALELEIAGVPARSFARLIDAFAQALLLFALLLPLTIAGQVEGTAAIVLAVLAVFAVIFVAPAASELLWQGRTPGKAALGLAVTTVEGGRVGVRHVAARSMLAVVDIYATTGLVAVVVAGVSRRGQRLGDLVAGTVVVRRPRGFTADRAVRFQAPQGLAGFAATLPVERLDAADHLLVRDLLLRADGIEAAARVRLVEGAVGLVEGRMGVTRPPRLDPESFLVCVVAASQELRSRRPPRRRLRPSAAARGAFTGRR
ncbi:MAG: RDD family protein [Actinomycetota bacterium]